MSIIIFSLTVLLGYVILTKAYKALKKADIEDKMKETKDLEKHEAEILEFKKVHDGDLNEKRKTIKNFTKE